LGIPAGALPMLEELSREWIAYSIIGVVLLIGIPTIVISLRKRHRQKLRRRGIKTYGH
jgi:hypothetical protein